MLPPTPWRIDNIYHSCVWHGGLDSVRVDVEIEPGRVHKLHRLRVKEWRMIIARMLRATRSDLHRTVSPGGFPWRAARTWADDTTYEDEHYAEQMLALGVAAGFVTIIPKHIEGIDQPTQHFVVVENARIAHWLAEERRSKLKNKN